MGWMYPLSGLLSLVPQQLVVGRILSFYGYTFQFVGSNVLAASATGTANVGIQTDADFIVVFAGCTVTSTDDATQLGYVPQLVLLTDTGAGSQLTQTSVMYDQIYGNAQNPGIFNVPYPMRGGSTMQVTHQNLEAVNRNVRGVFQGFRSVPDPEYGGF